MKYKPDDIVKSCRKLESGLRFGQDAIRACQLGPFCAPDYWTAEEAAQLEITKEMIIAKRRWLFELLNDGHADISCKQCHMVESKPFATVDFSRLGHVDVASSSLCNLRCNFCAYAMYNLFAGAEYDALKILKLFSAEDVLWDSAVDFNGGEPTLLPNLNDYLDYFSSRKIRVFFYTNAVEYSQAVFDGLINGTIRWVCCSLDAGTPSTFLQVKKRDKFNTVLQNLTRYAYAGSLGGGQLAVKYIFCEDNCNVDDVSGFAYAMLAIRPQQVWLTFNFEPLQNLPPDSNEFGDYDYDKLLVAYIMLFRLLKKYGLKAGHFTENHLAAVCRQGKILLGKVEHELAEDDGSSTISSLLLKDFRQTEMYESLTVNRFSLTSIRLAVMGVKAQPWLLPGKRVVVAPASVQSQQLLKSLFSLGVTPVGVVDRDIVLHGKLIENVTISAYESLRTLRPDVILVAVHPRHEDSIVATLRKHSDDSVEIAVVDTDY